MGQAARPRHVDAALDRRDPGRAGIGHDDARRPQDRQAADDAQAPVHGAAGEDLAVLHRHLHDDVRGLAGAGRRLTDRLADHGAGHRVDGGLADRDGKAGTGHSADARARAEDDALAGFGAADAGADQRAVRHVRVVARVLDHAGRRPAFTLIGPGQRESRRLAAGQGHGHRIGELAGEQRLAGRARGGGGAGARCPAPAQRLAVSARNAVFRR